MDTDLSIVRGNFTDVPIIIGEFDASQTNCEPSARWRWFDHFVRQAKAVNTAFMIWDNGMDQLDRATHTWRDQVGIDIIMNALNGTPNSLPDGTTDGTATSQSSSAYIFHKVGTPVTGQELRFLLNGNTFGSIKLAHGKAALSSLSDYAINGSTVTFRSTFLDDYVSETAAPGSKTNITLSFSRGAALNVEVVQWDVPQLGSTSSKAVAGSDLKIPIKYKGIPKPAAVKAMRSDGTYPFDSWTKGLGPLQQARAVRFSEEPPPPRCEAS